jgi:cytochrome c biogenesis protein CcmG/thiol:disulfide interchange protein DsbE
MSDQTIDAAAAKPGWTRFAPLVIFLLVLAGVIWALQRGGVRHALEEAMVGKPAPAYTLAALNPQDATVTPAAFAGKPYLINFFAENCAPCKAEHPILMALAEQGVPILGVVYKDEPEDAAKFLRELGSPYAAVGLDPPTRLALELGVAGTPETFVIGPDGAIRAMHRGQISPEVLDSKILPALTASPAS